MRLFSLFAGSIADPEYPIVGAISYNRVFGITTAPVKLVKAIPALSPDPDRVEASRE
jgi:hypothetical protein